MAGLKTWFKQNWVDIGSKRKKMDRLQNVAVQNKEGCEKEISKMRASSESEKDVRGTEKICRCQETGSCQGGT